MEIFNTALVQPLLNALMFLYKVIPGHDLGVAIILLTVVIRGILYIPSLSSIKSQRNLQEIQPKLNEIKKKYKDNREEMGRQLMKFYKENKVNPFSSCLPLLIQLPILFALFRVFYAGLAIDAETGLLAEDTLNNLYGPLKDYFTATTVNTTFLGFISLTNVGNWGLALLSGALQFVQSRMLLSKKGPKGMPGAKDENMAAQTSKTMTYLFPVMIVIIGMRLPTGLILYWVAATLFAIVQQFIYFKRHPIKTEQPEVIDQKTNDASS